ncbi:inositol polyphosphate multikinase [Electrophorus electricus]|nr:inositol polyphosphate multikinase [Electrophorus electricus]
MQHQIVDSSVALARMETGRPVASRSACQTGPGARERLAQQMGSRAHLEGCVPLAHQVAGHKYGVDQVGILQHPDGTVLKQLQPPPRGPREMQFYTMVYAEDCQDPCLLQLQQHLPKYFGTWCSPDSPTELYLKLEDVTRQFQKPCIMDVKIGQRSYDPFASQEKREQQIRKYPLMEDIGFLVLGMRVYNVGLDSFDTYDQHYGRSLVKDTIKDGLSRFFYNGEVLRKDAITASIAKVQKILQWFEGQRQLNFFASSLLFVYDGDCSAGSPAPAVQEMPEDVLEYNNNEIDQSLSSMYSLHTKGCGRSHHRAERGNGGWAPAAHQPNGNHTDHPEPEDRGQEEAGQVGRVASAAPAQVEVKMIDFAHVFPSEVADLGYVYGLRNLLMVLQQVLEDPRALLQAPSVATLT